MIWSQPLEKKQLLHGLMYFQSELQLSPNQEVWDLLTPIYFGDRNKPFDKTELSPMVVQVNT